MKEKDKTTSSRKMIYKALSSFRSAARRSRKTHGSSPSRFSFPSRTHRRKEKIPSIPPHPRWTSALCSAMLSNFSSSQTPTVANLYRRLPLISCPEPSARETSFSSFPMLNTLSGLNTQSKQSKQPRQGHVLGIKRTKGEACSRLPPHDPFLLAFLQSQAQSPIANPFSFQTLSFLKGSCCKHLMEVPLDIPPECTRASAVARSGWPFPSVLPPFFSHDSNNKSLSLSPMRGLQLIS